MGKIQRNWECGERGQRQREGAAPAGPCSGLSSCLGAPKAPTLFWTSVLCPGVTLGCSNRKVLLFSVVHFCAGKCFCLLNKKFFPLLSEEIFSRTGWGGRDRLNQIPKRTPLRGFLPALPSTRTSCPGSLCSGVTPGAAGGTRGPPGAAAPHQRQPESASHHLSPKLCCAGNPARRAQLCRAFRG